MIIEMPINSAASAGMLTGELARKRPIRDAGGGLGGGAAGAGSSWRANGTKGSRIFTGGLGISGGSTERTTGIRGGPAGTLGISSAG